MTIELTEKDIEAIAKGRAKITNKVAAGIVGLTLLWLAAIVGANYVLSESGTNAVILVGGIGLICLLVPILVAIGRKERRILKQLKQEHGE